MVVATVRDRGSGTRVRKTQRTGVLLSRPDPPWRPAVSRSRSDEDDSRAEVGETGRSETSFSQIRFTLLTPASGMFLHGLERSSGPGSGVPTNHQREKEIRSQRDWHFLVHVSHARPLTRAPPTSPVRQSVRARRRPSSLSRPPVSGRKERTRVGSPKTSLRFLPKE